MTIALNPDLERRIDSKVKSGRYHSTAEVIQESLDLLEARDGAVHDADLKDASSYNQPPIWEQIVSLGRQVPDEQWAEIPDDLARNVDHYLYGAPKASE